MLLIISNNNMSLRELYSAVLDNHPAGWITSFMSGLPDSMESLVAGYDAVIYELGPADKEERVGAVNRLLKTGKPIITHVEGRQATQRAEDLRAAGVHVVANPVTGAGIEATLDAVAATLRRPGARGRGGVAARLRRFLKGS